MVANGRGFIVKGGKHEILCRALLPKKVKVSMAPTNSLNRNKGFAGWRMIRIATDSPVKAACFLHVLAIRPADSGARIDASAALTGDKVALKMSVGAKNYEVLFNISGKCGGSIKAGKAPAVKFAEKIVVEDVLINKPGVQ